MAWSGSYLANVLPHSDSPAWTRAVTGTPTAEAVSGGLLRVACPTTGHLAYIRTDTTSGFTYAEGTVRMRLASISPDPTSTVAVLDGFGFDFGVKSTMFTGLNLVGATTVRCSVHNGTSWVETDVAVASTTDAQHDYRIVFNSGTVRWYRDGVQIHTYTGTHYTALTENRLRFGDLSTGAAATDGYIDQVDFNFDTQLKSVVGIAAETDTAQAFTSTVVNVLTPGNQLSRGEVDEDLFESGTLTDANRRDGYFGGGTVAGELGKLKVTSSSTTAHLTTQRKLAKAQGEYNVSITDVRVAPDGVFCVDLSPSDADASHAGIIGFADSAGTTGYGLRVGLGAGVASEVIELNTGTATVRGTTSPATGVASGATKRVKLYKRGATIGAVVDGVAIAEWTDSPDLVNPAYIWFGARSAAGSAADYFYDNYHLCRTNDLYVRGLTAGNAVRVYSSADAVLASAVADANGMAQLDLTAVCFPFAGYLRYFEDNTYATELTDGRVPASGTQALGGDDEFYYAIPSTVPRAIALKAHSTYSTGQYSSGGAAVINGTKMYGIFMGQESRMYVYEYDTVAFTTRYVFVGNAEDHHDIYSLVADSAGILHIAYGGGSGQISGYYQSSTNPWDITAWSAQTSLSRDTGILLNDSSDDLLHFLAQRSTSTSLPDTSIVHRTKASGGAWTAGTTLVTGAADWLVWVGDAILGREASGRKALYFTFHTIKRDGSSYKVLAVIKSTDGGANWTTMSGTAVTLPITQNNTTGEFTPSGIQVHTGAAYLGRLGIEADDTLHLISHEAGTGSVTAGTDIQHWRYSDGSWALEETWLGDQIVGSLCLIGDTLVYMTSPNEGRNIVRRKWSGSAWTSTTILTNTPTDGAAQSYYSGKSYWIKSAEGPGGAARIVFHNRHSYYGDGGRYTTGATPTYRGTASLLTMEVRVSEPLSPATETDTAQPLTASKTATLSPATETGEAQPLTHSKGQTLSPAAETDEAQALTPSKSATIGPATEADSAEAITPGKSQTLGISTETDEAQALTASKTASLGIATETDTAQPFTATLTGSTSWLTNGERALMRSVASSTFSGTAVIQTRTLADNGQGGRSATWAASGTVACNLAPVKRRGDSEQLTGGRALTQEYRVLTLPAETTINETDRAVISGVTYEVTRVDAPRSYEITRRVRAVEID